MSHKIELAPEVTKMSRKIELTMNDFAPGSMPEYGLQVFFLIGKKGNRELMFVRGFVERTDKYGNHIHTDDVQDLVVDNNGKSSVPRFRSTMGAYDCWNVEAWIPEPTCKALLGQLEQARIYEDEEADQLRAEEEARKFASRIAPLGQITEPLPIKGMEVTEEGKGIFDDL